MFIKNNVLKLLLATFTIQIKSSIDSKLIDRKFLTM